MRRGLLRETNSLVTMGVSINYPEIFLLEANNLLFKKKKIQDK